MPVNDARANSCALALGKPIHEIHYPSCRTACELLDASKIIVVQRFGLEREPSARAVLNPATATTLPQLVLSDPAHPRARRASLTRPKATSDEKHRREHLSR
jgi:hypothetical protein